jgi:hypothetical protein
MARMQQGVVEMQIHFTVNVMREEIETITRPDGTIVQQKRIVQEAVPLSAQAAERADKCKFFLVTKDAKLEALDADKAAGMLKEKTAILTGESAELDDKALELVKPGTLYIVAPPRLNAPVMPLGPAPPDGNKPQPEIKPPPPPRDEKP